MARSSGTYTAPANSWNPAVEGTPVDETDWNNTLGDIETAITESVYTGGLGANDNRLVRTDGTDTKKVQATGITVDDSDNVTGANNLVTASASFGTDNRLLRSDGTGKGSQASLISVDDSGNASGIAGLTMSGALVSTEGALVLVDGANADATLPAARFVTISGPTSSFSISGFASPTNGREIVLYNATAQDMTITNDASSTAANRILTLTGSDVALTGTSVARFIYSAVSSRWILIGTQG